MQLVYHCVSSGNGGTVKDTGSKCVEPIFQPISNNFSSIFKWVSFSTAVNHHALQPWCIDPFDSNKASGTLEHSYSPMVSSRLTSFPTAFWWTRRISMTTSLISCYVCFCGTLRCYWGCSSSNMLSRTFWSCHSNISGAVLQIISTVFRVLMMVTVAPCFVVIFSMLLESTMTGLIMWCLYACLIDHFLVSIFVGVLDCRWFITSSKWNDTSYDTGFV